MIHMDRRTFFRASAVTTLALGGAAALASCAPQTATRTALRVGSTTDIDSLNPFTAFSSQSNDVFQLIYDNLLAYDANLGAAPSLASSVQRSPDGTTFTYTLRTDVKWHDGTEFSADDVEFTFTMIRDNNYGTYGAYLKDLTGITRPGANQIALTYAKPQTLDLGLIVPIVAKHQWEGVKPADLPKYANEKPVGTGPFSFTSWEKGTAVTVTRNDSWWGPEPAAQKVTWTKYGSDDIATQALKTGDVDIVPEITPTIFTGLTDAKDVKTEVLESFSFHMIGFNCSTAPGSKGNRLLLDQNIRQALSCAVNLTRSGLKPSSRTRRRIFRPCEIGRAHV